MSSAPQARNDIFTALAVATLLFLVLGIVIAVVQMRSESAVERTETPATRPAKGPELLKATEEPGTGQNEPAAGGGNVPAPAAPEGNDGGGTAPAP